VQAVITTASGTTTVTFTYDALGRRIAKRVVAAPTTGPVVTTTTTYVYDGEDIIWQEVTTDASGTPVTTATRYLHGPGIDEPLLVETGSQVLAVHADGLGSVTGLSDASQTLVEERAYTAFGVMQRSGSWPGLAYAYTGREWEPELGLSYYRARYHDPETGRFVSRDPIGFAGGDANLYGFVLEDPINRTDPFGLIVNQGFINQLAKMTDKAIRRTIRSLRRRIAEHEQKLGNPGLAQSQRHYEHEIRVFNEQLKLAELEAARRGIVVGGGAAMLDPELLGTPVEFAESISEEEAERRTRSWFDWLDPFGASCAY
jgi:RHS repeat-associated protein